MWHGSKNSMLAKSIVAINKIYHSLFNVYGICEALNNTGILHPEGRFEDIFKHKYNIIEGLGGCDLWQRPRVLDAILCNLAGFDFKGFNTYINVAEEEFGAYDKEALKESKMKVVDWLSP